MFIIEICKESGLPRNHTCINTTPLTVGGNVDLSLQCPIDHIRSGSLRIEDNYEFNETNEEEEFYYYTPLEEGNNYNNNHNNNNKNNNIYILPEEIIEDPSVGNIRS